MNFTELATKRNLVPNGKGELTGDLLRAAKSIEPGGALKLDGKSGDSFALLAWDDFEVIMERAGMRVSNSADEVPK